jgi:hypothetical protein
MAVLASDLVVVQDQVLVSDLAVGWELGLEPLAILAQVFELVFARVAEFVVDWIQYRSRLRLRMRSKMQCSLLGKKYF